MPNHVENLIILSGEPSEINKMLEAVKSDEYGLGTIDFNKVIPMPKSLDITCGSITSRGIKMVNDYISNVSRLKNADEPDFEELLKEQTKNVPDESREAWDVGVQAYMNIKKYGCPTWYEWSINNWGTKWNAYGYIQGEDYSYNSNQLSFETAWSAPTPVIIALSERFPNIVFQHKWADEDIGNNIGDRSYIGGKCVLDLTPTTEKESLEFACDIWGYDMEDMGLRLNIPGTNYVRTYMEDFELIELFGKPALFTNDRLTEADVPIGLNLYHIRMTDDEDRFGSIEPKVLVNHGGSVLMIDKIDFGEQGYIAFNEDNDPNFLGQDLSIDDYISEHYIFEETATEDTGQVMQ